MSYDDWLRTKSVPKAGGDWSHNQQDVFFINNTGQNITGYYPAMRASIAATGKLPSEFDDIFQAIPVGVDSNGKYRVRLEMA